MLESYFHKIYTQYLNIANKIYSNPYIDKSIINLQSYMDTFFNEQKKAKRCGAIIFSDDFKKILLVKNRKNKKWGLPKGAIKPYENYIQCAIREVWEETGINLYSQGKIIDSVSIDDNFYLIVHLFKKTHLNIIDKAEIQAINFIYIENIPNLYSNISLKAFYLYYKRLF